MIHVFVTRSGNDPSNEIQELKISVTQESLPNFFLMIDRALNCWDNAPKEIKDFGDMITHGRITQDHTYKPINSGNSTDYHTTEETAALFAILEEVGEAKYQELLMGDRVELNKLLKAKLSHP